MARTFGTLWARYRVLILFWLATLLLIVASLVIQLYEADTVNRFVITRQESINSIRVIATYPEKVLLPSGNTPVQEIAFTIIAPDTTSYVIWIQSSEGLVFYDDNGKAIVPRWEGQGDGVFRAVVQAMPHRSGNRILLQARIAVNSSEFPIFLGPIVTESLGQSRWRIGLGIFARNIALPLGLLSAITGWVVSYLGKESDKAANTFRENLSKLSADFDRDPLFAVAQSIDLMRFAQKKHLDHESIKNLQREVSRLCHHETLEKIAQQLSDLAEQGETPDLLEALRRLLSLPKTFPFLNENKLSTGFFSSLDKIHKWLDQPTDPNLVKEALEGVLSFWDQFDLSGSGLVIHSLSQLPSQPNENVKEALEKTSHRKRLIRYQQLDWMRKSYGLTLPGEYQYISPFQVSCMPETLQVTVPYADFFNRERFVNESWVGPIQWEDLISTDGFACFFAYESDAEILLRKLWRELTERQNRPRDGIFPVYWDVTTQDQAPISLEQIAHRVAGTWFEFLSFNPNAFLDLRSAERDALVGYLGWHVGSLPALLGRLRQRFLSVGDSIQQEKEAFEKEKGILLEKVANSNLPYNKGDSPREEQLFDWLGIRPPWLTNTVIIVVCQKSLLSEWQKVVNAHQKDLLKQKVVAKGLMLTTEVPVSPAVLVSWSDDALMNMLRSRAQRASGGDSFSSLFSQFPPIVPPLDYDRRLVQKSNGSLGRMLELGQQIILHHAVYHENEPYLLEDDFKVIENA